MSYVTVLLVMLVTSLVLASNIGLGNLSNYL